MNDKLAAFSRFLPKLAEKAKPFFRLLKGPKTFIWDDTFDHMFTQIKKDIVALPVLINPPPITRIPRRSTDDHQLGVGVQRREKAEPCLLHE